MERTVELKTKAGPETKAGQRNVGLDFLKVAACFAVVVLHVTGMAPVTSRSFGIQNILYYLAVFAVPMFFLVNGYLLLGKPDLSYRYILKKMLSILAVVLSWNVLIFLEKLAVEGRTTDPLSATLKSLLQGDYFWQFWFFGALLLIYSVLPPIHKLFKRFRAALLLTGILIVLCLAVDLASIILSGLGKPIVQVHVRQTFRLWTWLAYFLLGGLLGKKQVKEYILKRLSVPANWAVLAESLVIVCFYQYNVGARYHDGRGEMFYDNIFTFVYVVSMFVLVKRHDYTKYLTGAIQLVSRNVMGIYIIHVTIITALTTLVFKTITQGTDILLNFIVFAMSLAVSVLISKIPLAGKLVKL